MIITPHRIDVFCCGLTKLQPRPYSVCAESSNTTIRNQNAAVFCWLWLSVSPSYLPMNFSANLLAGRASRNVSAKERHRQNDSFRVTQNQGIICFIVGACQREQCTSCGKFLIKLGFVKLPASLAALTSSTSQSQSPTSIQNSNSFIQNGEEKLV